MIPQLRFLEFTDEWQVEKLGDIAQVSSGGTPNRTNPRYWNGNIPWITTSEINFNTITRARQFITEEGLNNSAAKFFPAGSILIALYGQGKTRGKVANLGIDATTNQACAAILPKDHILNHSFIFQNLAARYDELRKLSNDGSQKNLSGQLVKSLKVVKPTLEEQQKIADYMEGVDDKLASLQNKMAAMHEYKKGVMQVLFSGKLRFKDENGNPYPDWETKQLGDIVTIKTGKKDVNQGNPKGKYPFFTCAREHTYSDEYSFDGEAIMIAGNGEVGLCTYYNGKFEAYQRTYVLQDFNIPAKYLFIYLKEAFQAFAESQKQQGSMPYIKLSTLQDFKVPIQSEEEQQKISDFLSALEDKIKLEEAKLASTKEFKRALLQRMFV